MMAARFRCFTRAVPGLHRVMSGQFRPWRSRIASGDGFANGCGNIAALLCPPGDFITPGCGGGLRKTNPHQNCLPGCTKGTKETPEGLKDDGVQMPGCDLDGKLTEIGILSPRKSRNIVWI
jgi:hypothetical protein